jgi:hypothetical protein
MLHGVAARAADDAWAVGESFTSHGLILHWDGSRWSVVPTPPGDGLTTFFGVEALASDDVWVLAASTKAYFLHWDGITWTQVPGPAGAVAPLGLAAISPNDIWAVGGDGQHTATEHWDGTSWTAVRSPNVGAFQNMLTDVAGLAAEDVWAVGSFYDFSQVLTRTLVEHWDGVKWSVVDTPVITASTNVFEAVTVTPDRHVWGAGFGPAQSKSLVEEVCPALITGEGFAPQSIDAFTATGVAWLFDPANVGEHSVTDASGLGLFDSGPRGPGSGFAFSYFSAGTYEVIDTLTGHMSIVKVPLHAWPQEGPETGTFHISWAGARLPGPYVADIQVRRPGAPGFEDWKTDQSFFASTFVPDAGPGTYLFRARARDPLTGAASEYSPLLAIVVH